VMALAAAAPLLSVQLWRLVGPPAHAVAPAGQIGADTGPIDEPTKRRRDDATR
jgi:hypothetical protein